MNLKSIAVVGLTVLVLAACAAQPVPPPEWTYGKDGIQVALKSDPKLNFDEGVPHTLLVCLYQLKDPNSFNQLSEDTDGIYKLLECKLFDPSVATAKRIIVRPGQDVDMTLDRAEGAKYVAVVAGYYTLEKARMIRLYDIPVVIEKKGLVRTTKTARPDTLKITVQLGPSQIN
jgi:type VI secretion system VasD/TssJ family lipoprotein